MQIVLNLANHFGHDWDQRKLEHRLTMLILTEFEFQNC